MASDVSDEFENYDVFISHRGPDTKTGFVSFLHKGLEDAGMRPFLDRKSLDIGEDAWKCISHAIKNTPIGLVIFLENFAQSEWCLRELHAMLGTPSMKVLPIFYKVKPRDVKYPESGPLKAGFEKLKRRHENAIIEQWRSHLEEASKIIGWEHSSRNERMEGDLVTDVVKKVCELANEELPLDVGECVVGVNEVAEGIIQTLHDKKEVLMLGLWGMGGIGKSTLARELYNRLCKRFGASCFVEDVKEKAAIGGVVKVQNQILEDLCKDELEGIKDKSKGKRILEERLSKKQILVVLDDVCDNKEMDYCMTRKMLIEGSLCIVTSRDRRVFEKLNSFDVNHEIHTHSVQVLNREASKQVFTSYAFGGGCKVKPGFEELVANVSEACGGLPLVLKVCGALLKNEENVNIWEEVLKKLKHGSIMDEESIFECLKISYDALQRQDQEMFLDIACALLGESVNLAKCLWESYGWHPDLGVRQLVEKALIIEDDKGCFAMHDHLRDMGRRIERKKNWSKRTRLWMPESFELLRPQKALPDSLQTLVLSHNDHCSDWDANNLLLLFIPYLKELRILFCDYEMELISSLPKNLGWFKWKSNIWRLCPKQYIFDQMILQNSKLMGLTFYIHDHLLLSESFTHLRYLEVLNLNYCEKLISLPRSFGCLKNLRDLNLGECGIECLPQSFGDLISLEVLNLRCSKKLNMLPNSFGGLKNLRDLNLGECGIGCLPQSFGDLISLEALNLSCCRKLIMLPNSFGGLENLWNLNLGVCRIKCLPQSFGDLISLEVLNLRCCEKLNMLSNSFGGLKNLRDLNLGECGIECLPQSFGDLISLEVLNLRCSKKLNMLPNSFGGLKNLQYLNLGGCGIDCLPQSFGDLMSLKDLDLRYSMKFITLPNSFGGLKNLRTLSLQLCGLGSVP